MTIYQSIIASWPILTILKLTSKKLCWVNIVFVGHLKPCRPRNDESLAMIPIKYLIARYPCVKSFPIVTTLIIFSLVLLDFNHLIHHCRLSIGHSSLPNWFAKLHENSNNHSYIYIYISHMTYLESVWIQLKTENWKTL